MGHEQGAGGAEFDTEIPVGHGVQGVFTDPFKAQLLGHEFPVDGIGGASQGGGPQGQAVGPFAAIQEAFLVPLGHFKIGQQVVAEGDGLGHLEVGGAGHGGGRFLFRQGQESGLEGLDQFYDGIDGVPQPEADVRGHLVVPGTAGVEALTRVPHQGGEALFDIEVHVFQVQGPFKLTPFNFRHDLGHALFDVRQIGGLDNALLGQHLGVGQGPVDILAPEALVEVDGGGVTLDQVGHGFGETTGPGVGRILLAHDGWEFAG